MSGFDVKTTRFQCGVNVAAWGPGEGMNRPFQIRYWPVHSGIDLTVAFTMEEATKLRDIIDQMIADREPRTMGEVIADLKYGTPPA